MNKVASRVAVIIPAYNAEQYIQKTILSILTSTFRDYVLVVVNDGSIDSTEQKVRDIYDERIILVNRPNSGMSASRNYGIGLVDSEFIALCDADDLWHPKKLELQLKLMLTDTGIGFCYTEFSKYYGGDTQQFYQSTVDDKIDNALSGYIYHKMLLTNWALPSSVIFRRALWNSLGPFLCYDHQTDDWEYFVRASRGFKFAKLNSTLVLYRQPPVSLSRRIPTYNSTELMRSSIIEQFGLTSPQGQECDLKELKFRQYTGNRNFYDMHLSRGDFFVGFFGLCRLTLLEGNKLSTLLTLIKSARRRVLLLTGQSNSRL